jgi:tetratricopeptide (TPR) repeat protein
MPSAYPRRAANWLMRFARRITPPDQTDWARAMQSELDHVEGDWAALRWAVGGASVLARHALVRAVLPGTDPRSESLAKEPFSTEDKFMRKITLVAAGICTVASLLFFVAPAFRQAFRVSLTQWHEIIHATYPYSQPVPEALARRAEQQHDAEGIAFVALRDDDETESARLAEEAVHLDPNLTWVYAAVAVRYPMLPEVDGWVAQLEKWDPQNALPYLISAERIDIDQVNFHKVPHLAEDQSTAWQNALAEAFEARKLDTYLDRLRDLDRRVLLRYSVDDPYQATILNSGMSWFGIPSYATWDSSLYADSLLKSGETFEARGNPKAALEDYLAVARFGEMLPSRGGFIKGDELRDAYVRLAAISHGEGNKEQTDFYAALAASA